MQLDRLTVNLRARSAWEAMELGTALVRRHAAAIWRPWLIVTLPLFVVVNVLGWVFDAFTLAGLLMWWLKPVFDRVPLYVLSRAVFGAVPDTRETVAAQWRWGWKPMLHYLSWRRLSPARALYLPVDLLEGADSGRLRERRRVLGSALYGHASLLTLVCLHFEMVVAFGSIAGVLIFIPPENLPETVRAGWTTLLQDPPAWADLVWNFVCWLAMSVIEPFYVGAGFGLYLNRRTQIEAWDVEIAFRRLRARLRGTVVPVLLVFAVLCAPTPSRAQQHEQEPERADAMVEADEADETSASRADEAMTLPQLFGEQYVDDRRFREAVDRAYADPTLGGSRKVKQWARRERADADADEPTRMPRPEWLLALISLFAFIGEWGLWILIGLLLIALLATARYWLPWMRGGLRSRSAPPPEVESEALLPPEILPPDIAGAARKLWREGRPRQALALLYRASVEGMAAHAGVALIPGATEAECLRVARRLADADERDLFSRMVRVWQYAAYAQRLPGDDEFEGLLGRLQQRYGWAG